MKRLLLTGIVILPLLSSCALFNPAVNTGDIEHKYRHSSGSEVSIQLAKELQSKAGQLAWWQAGSTVAMAGMIGLGGYKVATEGGTHQIAALIAGSATLYGTNMALYKPTREQMYAKTVSSLKCIDVAFIGFDTAIGLYLKDEITKLSPATWETLDTSFIEAYAIAKRYDDQHKQLALQIVADLNVYLANMQPSPENTLGILKRSINQQITPIDQSQVQRVINNDTFTFAAVAGDNTETAKYKVTKLAEHRRKLKTLVAEMTAWIQGIDKNQDTYDPNSIATCAGLNINFGIAGVAEGTTVSVAPGTTKTFQIIDTSGKLETFAIPRASNDAGTVSVSITTNNGIYNLQVTALPQKTTNPVGVTVKDNGKYGASVSFEVIVP